MRNRYPVDGGYFMVALLILGGWVAFALFISPAAGLVVLVAAVAFYALANLRKRK